MSTFAELIELDNTLISSDLFKEHFVCDLSKCKGACCVEGDLGAPLTKDELEILDNEYDKIAPYLAKEGKEVIEKEGKYVLDEDGDFSTPLINGKECAYVVYDENKMLKCGIEQAWKDGATNFQKPISCHLYPVRVEKLYGGMEALNYDVWPICNDARACGDKLKVPIYKFVKSALLRKFGQKWYNNLCQLVDGLK